MSEHNMIVIGASAGGVKALMTLVHALPAHFPASVFVVLHIPALKPSTLPTLLCHAGPLRAFHPLDHELIEQQLIYVAPPDCHLLVEVGQVRLSKGLKEKRSRPAIDPLCAFSSPRVWSAGGRSDPDRDARRRNRWTAGGEAKRRCDDCSRPGLGPFPRYATQCLGVCRCRLYRALVQHCASVGPPRGR
ncbi:MAG: chemotaxis protein CheB [Ktedonobacteraceae bacterium]